MPLVYLHENSKEFLRPVICFVEDGLNSVEELNAAILEIKRLSKGDPCYILADLSKTTPPSLEYRKTLKKSFDEINDLLEHAYISVGNNEFLRVAGKFIFGVLGMKKFAFFASLKEATEAIPSVRD